LTSIGKHEGANEHLCYSNNLLDIIKQIQNNWKECKDIQSEAKLLWFMIHRNDRPPPPKIDSKMFHFEFCFAMRTMFE